jgi:glycosyltransferase involved in cell wall biosynthesis
VRQAELQKPAAGAMPAGQPARRPVRAAYVRAPAASAVPGRRARVSVIIPSYNYGAYLEDAVRSALSQDRVDVQVIIVDDVSTDDSAAIAERLAGADDRVQLIRRERNGGHAAAFNSGYPAADGEFIVRLDADDQLTPGSLARSVALFDAFPAVGLVYGHPAHFTTSVPANARQGVRSWSVWAGQDWIGERCRTAVNCITTPEAIVRASVMHETGALSTEIKWATDLHMWLRVAAISDVGHVDGCDQAFHRDHPVSITGRAEYTTMVDLIERKAVFDQFFSDAGRDLSRMAELRDTAAARLADEALLEACRAYDRGRTGSVDVDAFVDFAFAAYPDALRLRNWRALKRRRLVGPRLAPMPPVFTASLVSRRLASRARYRHWQRTGL